METLENIDTATQSDDHVMDQILEFRDRSHAENVRKLKAGIKCIFTVPACFLILMFFTGTSKIIFLVLWIVSLFIIAAYLIHVEYSDYKIQEMVNSLQDSDDEINSLIDIDQIHSKVSAPKRKLDNIIADVRSGIQAQADTPGTDAPDTDNNIQNTDSDAPDTDNNIQNTDSDAPDMDNNIQNTDYDIQDTDSDASDTDYDIQDADSEASDTDYDIQDADSDASDTDYVIQNAGADTPQYTTNTTEEGSKS